MNCPVCDGAMRSGLRDWERLCPACGFLASTLPAALNDGSEAEAIDESRRQTGLSELRKGNFERIVAHLATLAPPTGASLLDVGCAHGWFLDVAARYGYAVHGLEPDRSVAEQALSKGYPVEYGFFPNDIPNGRSYDVICFNDVFEHLDDPRRALASVREHLNPNGMVVINLPSSKGAFFRAAAWLDRVGVRAPYERLWQKGLPSPHRSYFHPDALSRLAMREGLREVFRDTLQSFRRQGLWQRLRFDRGMRLWLCLPIWVSIVIGAPLLRRLPSDISLQIFRLVENEPGAGPS